MIFVLIIHSIVCVLLVIVILMQSGRGGGLTEGFAAAENMFGAKTNEFMVKATSVLAVLFVVTSLTLAYFSARRDESIMARLMDKTKKPDITINIPLEEKDKKTGDSAVTAPEVPDQKEPEPVVESPAPAQVPAASAPEKK